ncbi:MAG: (Fe-S)-binding protein [SAR202 cluster bacterium]|nr:hypothetical protein [Chloroflexota bacterium]MQG51371.1 (Fe-S)-binding protein [SAR202 cluster bacterium]|tara:strand:+ start:8885 stop:10177 length:1293 start_codon:yes stop_codon:yes gene_type:complete
MGMEIKRKNTIFTGTQMDIQDLYKCVHCGLCLSSCPTYTVLGKETDSPRGRIAYMKAIYEEKTDLTPRIVSHLDSCLQCRACESVCPSGVPFGRLMEHTKSYIVNQKKYSFFRSVINKFLYKIVFPKPFILSLTSIAIKVYKSLQIHKIRIIKPTFMTPLDKMITDTPKEVFRAEGSVFYSSTTDNKKSVALLSGCVMPIVQSDTMRATVRVLNKNGCDVFVPELQKCCGALNIHGGDLEGAKSLAKANIDAFIELDIEAIIVVSGGCGAIMKEYYDLFQNDPDYLEKAIKFSSKVKDIAEYLIEIPIIKPEKKLNYNVTYQDSCHLSNVQKITTPPRKLLEEIEGITIIEMEDNKCCGAAGVYSLFHKEMSSVLAGSKMDSIESTRADVVISGNPGCMIQINGEASKRKSSIKVMHLVDILDEAYTYPS